MLPRKLEPEVMDTVEEATDYDSMDHAAVNQLFVIDFLAAIERAAHEVSGGLTETGSSKAPLTSCAALFGVISVLDVGTGTAQIPIELCRRDRRVRVKGVDLAAEMLKVGRKNVEAAKLAERIELELVDAKGLPYPDGSFAAVMSNSIVHHIPEPRFAIGEMVRVCRSGGLIFVRDLLRPESERELERLVAMYAGDSNEHQQLMFHDSLHAALTLAEIRAIVGEFGFERARVTQTSDRHWTWVGRK